MEAPLIENPYFKVFIKCSVMKVGFLSVLLSFKHVFLSFLYCVRLQRRWSSL